MPRYLTVVAVTVAVVAACSGTPAEEGSPADATNVIAEVSTTTATAATTTTVPVSTTVAPETTTSQENTLLITSPSFEQGADIPMVFSCDGNGISPELRVENLPDNTVTLALIMDDPDAPGGTWVHWVAFDFPPTDVIPEGIPLLGIGGKNSWGTTGYGGPCPPSGTHRYFFKLFALDRPLELPEGSTIEEVLDALEGHVLDRAELMGRYTR